MGVLGGGWTMESGGGQGRGGWIKESVNLVSVGGWVCVCVGVLSVGLGPGLDSMSPARSRRSASHAAGTHGWLPQKTGRPGLRRGGVGGYNLHSVPPNSPPDCGTVAHQPRAGCIRLVLYLLPYPLLAGGGPIFLLVVHQPASPSIWLAVPSLRRGLSINPGVTTWCVCGCS